MKKYFLFFTAFLIYSCAPTKEEALLTENVWVGASENFAAVKFTDDGYGYDLINITDTLKYKFEDNKFLMIDQKGDQTRTLTFEIKKLDKDSFIVEVNQKEPLRLKFRKAELKEILYGSWKSKDFSFKFLSYSDSGSGFKLKANDTLNREFFSYSVTNNDLIIRSNNTEEKYKFEFDKTYHKLKLNDGKNSIDFIRNKFHDN